MAEELYRRHPAADEGRLARLKANIVSRRSCTVVARRLGLGDRMLALGVERGREDAARLAATPTVLAALVEAAIGAIYLVHGWEVVREAVVTSFADRFVWAEQSRLDPKTELQETLQRQGRSVQYVVVSDTGPAHAKHFESDRRRRRRRARPRRGPLEEGLRAGGRARSRSQHLDASRRR